MERSPNTNEDLPQHTDPSLEASQEAWSTDFEKSRELSHDIEVSIERNKKRRAKERLKQSLQAGVVSVLSLLNPAENMLQAATIEQPQQIEEVIDFQKEAEKQIDKGLLEDLKKNGFHIEDMDVNDPNGRWIVHIAQMHSWADKGRLIEKGESYKILVDAQTKIAGLIADRAGNGKLPLAMEGIANESYVERMENICDRAKANVEYGTGMKGQPIFPLIEYAHSLESSDPGVKNEAKEEILTLYGGSYKALCDGAATLYPAEDLELNVRTGQFLHERVPNIVLEVRDLGDNGDILTHDRKVFQEEFAGVDADTVWAEDLGVKLEGALSRVEGEEVKLTIEAYIKEIQKGMEETMTQRERVALKSVRVHDDGTSEYRFMVYGDAHDFRSEVDEMNQGQSVKYNLLKVSPLEPLPQ